MLCHPGQLIFNMKTTKSGNEGPNWAFIMLDYNKRKAEAKQLAEKIKQIWDKN